MTDSTHSLGAQALILGALISATASLAHLACIVIGASAYRFMGAGERMALAAEAGKLRPTLVTLAMGIVLLIWSAYALSGARVISELPMTRPALVLICCAYLGRAIAFPLLKPIFPENSDRFWWVSSGICGVAGCVHVLGTLSLWDAP